MSDHIPIQRGIEALGGCYDPTDTQCSQTPPTGDPAPGDSGIYLGTDFTRTTCTAPSINDDDHDNFDDFCEFQIALAFRPLLATDPLDQDLTRQSYWGARWDGLNLDVAYLIGYYFDNGNEYATVCQGSTHVWCWGHFGDSEFVIARITYDGTSKHWKLVDATLSAHFNETCPIITCDYTSTNHSGALEYPTKRYHYPRVYVSKDKHANYRSRSACNDGGAGNSDDCTYAQDHFRIDVNRYRNVGNSSYPQITSTTSTVNPTLYYGTEYYFNNLNYVPFCGWDGPSAANGRGGGCATTGYEQILYNFGFGIAP